MRAVPVVPLIERDVDVLALELVETLAVFPVGLGLSANVFGNLSDMFDDVALLPAVECSLSIGRWA
jgi:hypothetical protein